MLFCAISDVDVDFGFYFYFVSFYSIWQGFRILNDDNERAY